jgi:hypothetical protein
LDRTLFQRTLFVDFLDFFTQIKGLFDELDQTVFDLDNNIGAVGDSVAQGAFKVDMEGLAFERRIGIQVNVVNPFTKLQNE